MEKPVNPADVAAALSRRLGPHADAFCTFAIGELWRRATETAIGMGLTPLEAHDVARLVSRSAVKALVGGINQAKQERVFRRKS